MPSSSPDTSHPAFHYRWTWAFHDAPERVWPLVSDTQRFNEATGLPVAQVNEAPDPSGGSRRTLKFRRFGIPITWDEFPFEWIQPVSFGVLRVYHGGPVAWMQVRVSLSPQDRGGTTLLYEILIHPRHLTGYLIIPIQVGLMSRRAFDRVFRQIDRALQAHRETRSVFPLAMTPLQPAADVLLIMKVFIPLNPRSDREKPRSSSRIKQRI